MKEIIDKLKQNLKTITSTLTKAQYLGLIIYKVWQTFIFMVVTCLKMIHIMFHRYLGVRPCTSLDPLSITQWFLNFNTNVGKSRSQGLTSERDITLMLRNYKTNYRTHIVTEHSAVYFFSTLAILFLIKNFQ